ncbi:MAG: hypothetical protein PVF91_07270 [Chromatiales bacterium]|jgi:hypothetical protein
MLEYIFFDERPWRRFSDFVREKGVEPECSSSDEGWLVAVSEDIDDALADELEGFYDRMMVMDEAIVAGSEGAEHVHTAGVTLTLGDGRTVLASVDPELLGKVMAALSAKEIGDFVAAIVDAVEHPDERPMCKR